MTLYLSTERPDPNVSPIADAEIVVVTENSPQDLQPLYDREVDIEAETTSNPVNTACPYPPDVNPDPPPTPPEDDPEPEPEPETIHVTVTAGSANICHNATELPELTQSVSPEIPGGSLGSPTVPDWTPETHDPGDTFPVIPGTWTPPDDGKNYEITYVNGTLTVIHCTETHYVTITADNKTVCHYATELPELTQSASPEIPGGSHDTPTVPNWTSERHTPGTTFPIIPGTWTPPDDGDIYEITYVNGTLTVIECPTYYIDIDAQVCPTQLQDTNSKHYIANNASGTIFIEQGQNGQFDTEQTQLVECVLAAKIIPIVEEGSYETAEFRVDYEIDRGQEIKETGSTEIIVESWYVINVVINDLFPLSDYMQAIKNAEISGNTWSQSVNVTIRVTRTDDPNDNHEETFTLTPTLTLCPLTHVMENNFIRCHHRWTPGGSESNLWAGTATVE